jgi:myosin protein heavy chain
MSPCVVCDREKAALAKTNKKVDKRAKELAVQAEEEKRNADQFKDQVRQRANVRCYSNFYRRNLPVDCVTLACVSQLDKANARLRVLKRQLEEAEEENSKLVAQKRKIQRDLDEQQEHGDSLARELDTVKSRIKGGVPAARCAIDVTCYKTVL